MDMKAIGSHIRQRAREKILEPGSEAWLRPYAATEDGSWA
jgi:hypothetical protein